MILTLTINPAIDHNISADRLVFEDRAYILARNSTYGGRGINASSVIHSFGGVTRAIATSGGENGARLEQYLADAGFPVDFVPIRNQIRTNLTITDKQGLTIKLNELGPVIEADELKRVEEVLARSLDGSPWVMICGSVPPGVPETFYAGLVEMCRARGVMTLIDTDGDSLRYALEAGPTVVAPNQSEAERLLETVLITRTHWIRAAKRMREMGADAVILSLGSRGAIGVQKGLVVEATPPRVDAVCPIGAGDALAAAFVWAMAQGNDFADAVRWGVAAGTASAKLPGVQFASLEQTREVYDLVEVKSSTG